MNYADIYILTPKKDNQATPQSILLHELGHMVNLILTGDVGKLPEDFAVITSLLNLNINKNDQNEFFAHCFAMSLLSETELVPFDPFPMVCKLRLNGISVPPKRNGYSIFIGTNIIHTCYSVSLILIPFISRRYV